MKATDKQKKQQCLAYTNGILEAYNYKMYRDFIILVSDLHKTKWGLAKNLILSELFKVHKNKSYNMIKIDEFKEIISHYDEFIDNLDDLLLNIYEQIEQKKKYSALQRTKAINIIKKKQKIPIVRTARSLEVLPGKHKTKCGLCNNIYGSEKALTEHLKMVHRKEPYACPNCQKAMWSIKDLELHQNKCKSKKVTKTDNTKKKKCVACGNTGLLSDFKSSDKDNKDNDVCYNCLLKPHCICRKTYAEDSRDMICCDICGTWYHFACVFINPGNYRADEILKKPEYKCLNCKINTNTNLATMAGLKVRTLKRMKQWMKNPMIKEKNYLYDSIVENKNYKTNKKLNITQSKATCMYEILSYDLNFQEYFFLIINSPSLLQNVKFIEAVKQRKTFTN